ncbi:MAG: DUF3467 domain-containing protein [Gaiellaceae bacterium]
MPDGHEINVQLPPELVSGVYANFALVQASEHDFTLDFCQITPPTEEGEPPTARVVSRVRIAGSFVDSLLQALSSNAISRDQHIQEMRRKMEGGAEDDDD